ncbi:DDE-domain-containing protein [Coniophora puteana RWD-64-598 SS2]|uniref:DDE-domain-containing protein n=1 Tax=Coniophora puteana (strain RWD-64-598) TaxID=741705 RepID=A0A5M3MXF8_CONPW|nr:DDE-domain-containing protein [Coniophora puteana RWD-64-598 SS2]EIW83687.1 DDE-domain-containing protein [Coniophora puteana RWD-64-598 SS2]
MVNNIQITGEVIRQKWRFFAVRCNIPADALKLSEGWLTKYKERMGLKEYKRHGEAASANPATVDTKGIKTQKLRLTYALCANATGTDKLRPLVIGKFRQPRAFNKKPAAAHGFDYRNNLNAWMTTPLYQDWISNWDSELRRNDRHILLLQDNFSGHVVPDGLTNIRVENFAPNLTAHVQPNDQGIIRCFKAHYRAAYIERAINRYDEGVTPSEIYQINQLQAMRLADTAWRQVDTTTIRNCWRKAGILPSTDNPTPPQPSLPISSLINDTPANPQCLADSAVEAALDSLQATGVLQKSNRMDLETILNPVEEHGAAANMTDEEIYEAVMKRRAGGDEESEGDEGDEGDGDGVEPPPTRKQVLGAASVIGRCLDEMDDPLARKLEVLLASFTRQLRIDASKQLEPSKITDYFTLTPSD